METKTIEIKGIDEKTSKAGRIYWSVTTQDGVMTCFDTELIKELKKRFGAGQFANVEIAKKDNFVNIRGLAEDSVVVEKIGEKESESFTDARKAKDVSIYTSYAKDLCIAILNQDSKTTDDWTITDLMTIAVNTIKQARDAFNK